MHLVVAGDAFLFAQRNAEEYVVSLLLPRGDIFELLFIRVARKDWVRHPFFNHLPVPDQTELDRSIGRCHAVIEEPHPAAWPDQLGRVRLLRCRLVGQLNLV